MYPNKKEVMAIAGEFGQDANLLSLSALRDVSIPYCAPIGKFVCLVCGGQWKPSGFLQNHKADCGLFTKAGAWKFEGWNK